MTQQGKVIYTAMTHTTGGRDGASRSSMATWTSSFRPLVGTRRYQPGATFRCRLVRLFRRCNGACGAQDDDHPAAGPRNRCGGRPLPE